MRLLRLLASPFGLACLGCLVLVGWALWSAGLLDGPIARQVRASSVYAAPGIDLDRAAAERVIGNRRLVVVLLEPDADLAAGCDSVRRAAAGTLVVLLQERDDRYHGYGCSLLPGREGDSHGATLGRAMAIEQIIGRGVAGFVDQPLEALKMMVINYDLMAKAGTIPDGARTVSPSLPRYLIAGAAVLAVLAGSTMAYAGARRGGQLAARHLARREAAADSHSDLSTATTVLAQQIIDLDRRYPQRSGSPAEPAEPADPADPAADRYRDLVTDYATLLDRLSAADLDEAELTRLNRRVESLSARCNRLRATASRERAGDEGSL